MLLPGRAYDLDGSSLNIDGMHVSMHAHGEGAIIDAQQRSRLFRLRNNASLELHNVRLHNGVGKRVGGGFLVKSFSTVLLVACVISDCTALAEGGEYADGGAMYLFTSCTATLDACTISGCTASSKNGNAYSGAIMTRGSITMLNASNVVNCSAWSLGDNGGTAFAGGLYLECERLAGEQCRLSLVMSMVSNCVAAASGDARGGGGYVVDGAQLACPERTERPTDGVFLAGRVFVTPTLALLYLPVVPSASQP